MHCTVNLTDSTTVVTVDMELLIPFAYPHVDAIFRRSIDLGTVTTVHSESHTLHQRFYLDENLQLLPGDLDS